jgi:toxin ParE1/3/4
MLMRLELSRRAQADLDDIRDYSVAQFGIERAIVYFDAIEQAFRRLLDHPRIGSPRPGTERAALSYAVGEHRIYYDAFDDRIIIQRVLHKAMDVERWV